MSGRGEKPMPKEMNWCAESSERQLNDLPTISQRNADPRSMATATRHYSVTNVVVRCAGIERRRFGIAPASMGHQLFQQPDRIIIQGSAGG